jgi:hypothetical protein
MKKSILKLKTLLILMSVVISNSLFSQENYSIDGNTIDNEKIVRQQFDSIFDNDEKKNDFKMLRGFLSEKEIQKSLFTNILYNNYIPENDLDINEEKIKDLKRRTEKKSDTEIIEIDDSNYSYGNNYDVPLITKYSVKEVNEKIETLIKKNNKILAKLKTNKRLKINIENIKQDIRRCQNQIDTALDPENRKQGFKMYMSLTFAILIGFLLAAFFYIVYKKSDNTLSILLLSGYGLQFITLFVLIIAIILFGILDILKGSELAAMLSGISGYILGKGIQDKKAVTDAPPPPPPDTDTDTDTDTAIPDPDVSDPVKPNQDQP